MIRAATEQAPWDAFLASCAPPTFLQSWAWGETQRALGEDVVRFSAVEGTAVRGCAQAVTVTARRGKFLHVPHGPVIAGDREQRTGNREQETSAANTMRELVDALREEAKKRDCAFVRVSPMQERTTDTLRMYRENGFRPAPIYLHSENLWVLDVTSSEETLLQQMRKTTRNLIRRAEREQVSVRLSHEEKDVEIFFRLYAETVQREHFVPFSEKLIREEYRCFGSEQAVIGIAEQHGQPRAAALAIFTPWSGFYHHGASIRIGGQSPASYALQWALIREAKRRGARFYNFWGIYPPTNKRYGITTFKTGFGGGEVSLVPTQDLPLSLRYWPAFALDTMRRWKRGL